MDINSLENYVVKLSKYICKTLQVPCATHTTTSAVKIRINDVYLFYIMAVNNGFKIVEQSFITTNLLTEGKALNLYSIKYYIINRVKFAHLQFKYVIDYSTQLMDTFFNFAKPFNKINQIHLSINYRSIYFNKDYSLLNFESVLKNNQHINEPIFEKDETTSIYSFVFKIENHINYDIVIYMKEIILTNKNNFKSTIVKTGTNKLPDPKQLLLLIIDNYEY